MVISISLKFIDYKYLDFWFIIGIILVNGYLNVSWNENRLIGLFGC